MTESDSIDGVRLQNAIEDLLARFDDAVIRYDRESFRKLWTDDGVWEISAPVPMKAVGIDAIAAALEQFHQVNEFFFRTTSRPVIQVEADLVSFRSPTLEIARRAGQIGYTNVAMYFDQARCEDGKWRFTKRYYQYLWVDLKTHLGGEIVPFSTLPKDGSSPPGLTRI